MQSTVFGYAQEVERYLSFSRCINSSKAETPSPMLIPPIFGQNHLTQMFKFPYIR